MHHSFDLSIFPVNSTLKMLASLLERITTANDKLKQSMPEPDPPLVMTPAQQQIHTSFTRFHARSIPSISISAYLTRILKYCPCANECFLSLLVYFDRMARNVEEITGGEGRQFSIDSYNIHRLIIAGVMVSAKFFSDVFFTNSRYAKVGGLPVWELNQLELEFLTLNNFSLAISIDELQTYGDQLIKHWRCEEVAQRGGGGGGGSGADQVVPATIAPPVGPDAADEGQDGSQRSRQDSRANGHDRRHDGTKDGTYSEAVQEAQAPQSGSSHHTNHRHHHHHQQQQPQANQHHHHHHSQQHQHESQRNVHGETSRTQPPSSQAQVQIQPAPASSSSSQSRGSPTGYRSEQGARFDRGLPTPPPPQPQQYHGYEKTDPRQQPLPAADYRPRQAAPPTSSGRHGAGGSPVEHARHGGDYHSQQQQQQQQQSYLPTPGAHSHHRSQQRSPNSQHTSPHYQHPGHPSVNTSTNGYGQGPITPTELSRNGSRLATQSH
ncbi:hypothetical protein DFQ26_008492 [Actinomortierella ambigua]|nr:hypothetical protein DFQ26_008492 [Actinomortierella ambigua]